MNDALQSAAAQLSASVRALLLALALLPLQALRVVALVAVPVARLACGGLAGYGALRLFVVVLARYGGDFPACVLALGLAVSVPAFLIASGAGAWGALGASGLLSIAAAAVLARLPLFSLALIPPICLCASIVYFLEEKHAPGSQE